MLTWDFRQGLPTSGREQDLLLEITRKGLTQVPSIFQATPSVRRSLPKRPMLSVVLGFPPQGLFAGGGIIVTYHGSQERPIPYPHMG